MKKCRRCKLEIDRALFSRDVRCLDGLQGCCKACNAAQHQEIRLRDIDAFRRKKREQADRNRAKVNERSRTWASENRERSREIKRRNKAKHAEKYAESDRRRSVANREARVLARQKWDRKNPECRRAITRNRRAKARGSNGSISKKDITDLLSLQSRKCAVCAKSLKSAYHVDHIVPLARNGANDKSNIQLLCPRCNQVKSSKDPIAFMQARGFLL